MDMKKLSEKELKRFYRTLTVLFGKEMEIRLGTFSNKKHWGECSILYLLNGLRKNVKNISRNHEEAQYNAVIRDCVDVANYAMMIADKCVLKKSKVTKPEDCQERQGME